MSSFCSQCGYKLDYKFKFCPNCGSQVEAQTTDEKTDEESPAQRIVVCEVCGEENLASNTVCSGCGARLPVKTTRQIKVKSGTRVPDDVIRKKKKKDSYKETKQIKGGRELSGNKILLISTLVVIVIVVLLISTGVFDSGSVQNQQLTLQSNNSGVDLSNINAISELESKVNANPNDRKSVLQLANLLQDSGLYERAITYYKKYLELEPGDPNARVDMSICYYNLNDFQSAITEMETALKYQPDHQLAHLNLGIVNLSAGNIEASKKWFRKAVEINPDSEAGKRAKELLQSH